MKTYRCGVKTGPDGRRRRFVALESANPDYPTIAVGSGQELDCFGKVTACIHMFCGR